MASNKRLRIAVLASSAGWHYQDLLRASALLEDIEALFRFQFEDLTATVDENSKTQFNLVSDCTIVRTMPAGSLQQIVFRMDCLAQMQRAGMHVVNSPKSIEAAVDKYLSLALLVTAGVPVPQAMVSQTMVNALDQFSRLGSDVVVKPLFGSMGNGIKRLTTRASAVDYFEEQLEFGQVIYQQAFVDHGGFDIRLLVIGNRVWGMKRTNPHHWITNISQGGIGQPYVPSVSETELALRSAHIVGASVAGVDLVYDKKTGQPLILEINAVPGWQATSEVLELDVAKSILTEIIRTHVRKFPTQNEGA